MTTKTRRALPAPVLLAMLALAAPVPAASAQEVIGVAHQQVQDLAGLKDKFVALSGAFSPEQMGWRPMEGVRSVREVVDLMVAEVHLFPAMWGFTPPAGVASGFADEMARVGALDADGARTELASGFDFMIRSVESLTPDQLDAPSDWFGTTYTQEAAIAQALGDMHEHLGQLIAYARANRVVPPWSR